jgi:Uma2 family endonuclease
MMQPHNILTEERRIVRSGATVEEYMTFENTTEERHEFHNGDIIILPSHSAGKSLIITNIIVGLGLHLCRQGHIYASMLKLSIPSYKKIVYPDVMITLGEEVFVEDDSMRLQNPVVVIEVLSKSTAKYDRTDKFEYYSSIPSVQEIVFITQNERFVELYRRQNGGWMMFDIADSGAVLHLESVQASLSLDDLYA